MNDLLSIVFIAGAAILFIYFAIVNTAPDDSKIKKTALMLGAGVIAVAGELWNWLQGLF